MENMKNWFGHFRLCVEGTGPRDHHHRTRLVRELLIAGVSSKTADWEASFGPKYFWAHGPPPGPEPSTLSRIVIFEISLEIIYSIGGDGEIWAIHRI